MTAMDRPGIGRRSISALVVSVLITGLVVVAVPGSAQQRDPRSRPPIARTKHGSFDSRSAVGVSGKVADARLALARTLGNQGVVDTDATSGTLRFVGRLDGFLTGPSARPAEAVALDYVREHRVAFGLSDSDIGTFHLRRDYVDILGTHHLSWVQRVDVEAFPNGLKANVTRAGRLINVSESPAAGLEAPTAAAQLDASAAIVAARSAAGGAAVRHDADQAKHVLFQTGRGTRLAWRTTTWVGDDALSTSRSSTRRTGMSSGARTCPSDVPGTGVAFDYFPGATVPNSGGVEHAVSFPVVNGTALSGNNAHVGADIDDNGSLDPSEDPRFVRRRLELPRHP